MAIEVSPDSPSGEKCPRISFSHDLSQADEVPVEQVQIGSRSSCGHDFDFCTFRASSEQESSCADELFSGGKILPIEIKKRLSRSRTSDAPPQSPLPQFLETAKNKNISAKASSPGSESEEKEQNHKPSFWSFKRSPSLNCSSGYTRRKLCPLPVFARSYSTGSAGGAKCSSVSNNRKQNILKNSPNIPLEKSKSVSCAVSHHQKPPLKKNNTTINNGINKVNPALNIPLANFFGLGSILSGGKYKSKKKY